jgi:hypothetical protein
MSITPVFARDYGRTPHLIAAVAANVLDRSFEAPAPIRKWIAVFA